MRRTRIKFCGLVRADDVRAAVALGVDAIGFVFYPRSPRLVSLDQAMALRRLMPSWLSAVGLFVDAPPGQVRDYVGRLGLDVVQFHGNETLQTCLESLPATGAGDGRDTMPWWRAVRLRGADDLLPSVRGYPSAEAFVVDAWSEGYGGSGTAFDWSVVPRHRDWSLILSGGLTARTVGEGIALLAPLAVDVSTGIQAGSPRAKDPKAMEAFVAAVAAADTLASERTS